ncbi:MAG: protein-disulfide reductase DsbD [Methylococcales bacterium]|nr:protein-disulfide reductase DsbD [Methylococcales bacterium]
MPFIKSILFCFFIFFIQASYALESNELLPSEQAFKVSAKVISKDLLEVSWSIADGYYLYQNKISVTAQSDDIVLDQPKMPEGQTKNDEFFGDVVIYREQLNLSVPIINDKSLSSLKVLVKYQGCADIGVCYPPQKKIFNLKLPQPVTTKNANPVKQLVNSFKNLTLFQQEQLLPAEQAFQFFATVKDANTLHVNWLIAEGYYLYRDKIRLSLTKTNNSTVQLADINIPQGSPYHDEAFGQVQIFHHELSFDVPLIRTELAAQSIKLLAKYQGCADRGVCYPPMESEIDLQLPESNQLQVQTSTTLTNTRKLSEQDQIFLSLKNDSLILTLVSFFGFGLLLAFTPCIFPMIPILSGIIVGQGKSVTTKTAFLLSLCYVTASALTYTVFGILAALFGSNLQTTFQEPWIIALFSSIFILLSLSMFGFYNLELPKFIQAKIHDSSDKHRDGSYIGAAIMGALSSLIIGPCVAAPLAGALIYIGQTGDVILGGSALFVMGFAMGSPLLVLGASAGSLLPKAGHWLNSTKAIFGVIMLAVSVWMLDRILPTPITLLLSASLLIIPAIYLRALDPLPEQISGWYKLWKGLGVLMLVYGILLLIGLSMGNTNPLQPLKGLGSIEREQGIVFRQVSSIAELENVLDQASTNNQWVMLDFYADWCISCKEMEAYTFSDKQVQQKLAKFILIQADVTKNSADDKALLKRFNLIGPPAILFFAPDKLERKASRVIGYQNSETFLVNISQLQ